MTTPDDPFAKTREAFAKTRETVIERIAENLYRVSEFRKWIDTNTLFPTVPDTIVKPVRGKLVEAEHLLVNALYDLKAIDRAVVIDKMLTAPAKK